MQFDVPMDDALFSMDVPEGYKQQQMELDLFGSTEADFIEGLRVLAEMFGKGRFPDSVAARGLPEAGPGDHQEVRAAQAVAEEQTSSSARRCSEYLLFLRFFKGEGKWYYRGKGVKLGEADNADLLVPAEGLRDLPRDLRRPARRGRGPGESARAARRGRCRQGRQPAYQQWSKPDFVGTQEDLWRITASGQITVQSEVTLMKGPQGTSVMPITLPYTTGILTSVSLGDTPVPFELAGAGQYKLQLPLDKLLAGQTKVTCTWTLVLADLGKESNNVPLKSLVPVVSYKLSVAVDPDSGWEYVKDPSQSSWVPFSIGNPPKPATDFGVCGLGLRRNASKHRHQVNPKAGSPRPAFFVASAHWGNGWSSDVFRATMSGRNGRKDRSGEETGHESTNLLETGRIGGRRGAVVTGGTLRGAEPKTSRPNVILVLTDDQGYGDFSCHGNPVLRTPNLDRLHGQSIRLTDFHVAPMCTPTRGELMTGLDALRNKARHVCGGLTMLRTDVPTMGDVFAAGGYRTGLFGKWHLGDSYPYRPQDRGFQEVVHHRPGVSPRRPITGATTTSTTRTSTTASSRSTRATAPTSGSARR